MLLGGLLIPVCYASAYGVEEFLNGPAWLLVLVPLAVSWLAVSVFKGDGGVERVRFLADRGVSPTMIWVGRHAVALANISFGCVVYTLVTTYLIFDSTGDSVYLLPSLSLLVLALAVVYGVSQWTSQLVRTLTLAVILAPVLAGLTVGYFLFLIKDVGTPIWMTAVLSALPIAATWSMMGRYIDMRDRPRSIVIGLGILAAFILLPLLAALTDSAVMGDMPAAMRAELLKEGRTANATQNAVNLIPFPWQTEDASAPQISPQQPAVSEAMLEIESRTPDQFIPALPALRRSPQQAATSDYGIVHLLVSRLMLQRLTFEHTPNEQKDAALAEYTPWLSAAAVIVRALRNNSRWLDQEQADRLEIVLADSLKSPALTAYLARDEIVSIVEMLPTRERRNTSRRRAVLASWAKSTSSDPKPQPRLQMGGIKFDMHHDPLPSIFFDFVTRQKEQMVLAALDALASNASSIESWQRWMHHLMLPPSVPFELGPYSPRFRDLPAIKDLRLEMIYPMRYWGMSWETDVDNLKDSLLSSALNQTVESVQ